MSVWKKVFLFSFLVLHAAPFLGAQTAWKNVKGDGLNDLVTVFFTSAERGYIAGDKGFFTFTIDGGKSWKKQFFDTDQDINEIYFRNDDNG
ncbi:MAG TPA: YCF48-related protein, partial [Pyrinomonadaceae bacterium]|nr:YCF48-related protein [Pyrinomonadaceae bacterium]